MDFLSLFDPSDGVQNKAKARHKEQENVNMKPEGTVKGRRRGRRANGKSETLPEESSFLNEPDLSTEIMVKDGSYIDSYIEISKEGDESRTEDKKVKKRNVGRKSRRRKKISPFKDFEKIYTTNNNFNTSAVKSKVDIGKNVNNLSTFKSHYRIDDNCNDQNGNDQDGNDRDGNDQNGNDQNGNDQNGNDKDEGFKDNAVYNVIDKLEKVSLKDDMYLAGDFTAQDLESDFFYCSDDDDEFVDDSTSDGEDSSSEVGRSLPPEPRFGNVEYKLRLSTQCERRFQHLVTQLKWRLVSGGGSCVYVIGVRDCGALVGLRARALRSSLRALRRMAGALHAHIAHLTARRVTAHRAVAEVYIKKLAHPQQSIELRVAVMGANEAGKSTLIGVLTQGELDNGNGSARLNMFRHQHEVKTGMTSSLSHEILGFDAQGNVVNYGCSELMTAERIGERSAKLVSFLDLAGHSKYQRTTRHGITGYSPHAAMLVISATAGVSPITEEHLGILLALRLPFFVVINKCELARDAVPRLLDRLRELLHHAQKKPLLITDEGLARSCCGPQNLILDSIDEEPAVREGGDQRVFEQVAVFPVSCVRGFGLNALHAHLLALQPPSQDVQAPPEEETCEFQIDEIFHVGDSGGPVVGGLLTRGRLFERDRLLIGPLDDGSFKMVGVRSIYRNRVPCGAARAGQPASLGLHQPCPAVRPGMVLLAVPEGYGRAKRRVWGACETACKRKLISELIHSKQTPVEARTQRFRKKNKNLLQDIAHAEEVLTKEIPRNECNIYHSDSDTSTRSDANSDKIDTKSYKSDVDSDKSDVKSYQSDVDSDKSDLKSYKSDVDSDKSDVKSNKSDVKSYKSDANSVKSEESSEIDGKDNKECICVDKVLLEDPNDPWGCIYFQANVHVIRHSTAIHPGFQCTVHVGNVRQTAIIEGIMSRNNVLCAGESASALFRFVRTCEYLAKGRQLLFTQGLGTRGVGRITQIFPYVP